MTATPDGTPTAVWSWVGHERTRSIHTLATWSLGAYLVAAAAVLVLILPRIVPLVTVVCLLFAAQTMRAFRRVTGDGFVDRRSFRLFTLFLGGLAALSWVVGVVGAVVGSQSADAGIAPVAATVVASFALTASSIVFATRLPGADAS